MSVTLSYRFDAGRAAPGDFGLRPDGALFETLAAIRAAGSISGAARQLGLSYRHVWGFLKAQEAYFGQALLAGGSGRGASLSAFGERLLLAEKRILMRYLAQAEALAEDIDDELLRAAHPGLESLRIATSHDFLLPSLRGLLRDRAAMLLDVETQGSAAAMERLNDGGPLLAGIHLPLEDALLCRRGAGLHLRIGRQLRLGEHKLIRLARREQGLMVAPGNPLGIRGVSDLARPGVRVINRRSGSGTRIMFDELLLLHGLVPAEIHCSVADQPTHLAVAAGIAADVGDVGVGLRAAAERFGLDFLPLHQEEFFVVCRTADFDLPAVQAIVEILSGAAFREAARCIPGYAADDAGQVISLRRSLPWYRS